MLCLVRRLHRCLTAQEAQQPCTVWGALQAHLAELLTVTPLCRRGDEPTAEASLPLFHAFSWSASGGSSAKANPQVLVLVETLAEGEAQQGQEPSLTPEATSCLLGQYQAIRIKRTSPMSQHHLVIQSSLQPASAHTGLDGGCWVLAAAHYQCR